MRETGLRTNNTDPVSKSGLMAHTTKVSTSTATRMELESFIGLTEAYTMVTFSKTTYTEKECMSGRTDANMMETGMKIRCMAMEYSPGSTAECSKAST